MFPKEHIIFGAIFSAILFFLFPQITLIGAIIVFLSSVLIDVDHYLYYVYKKRDWNLTRAFEWYSDKRHLFDKLSKKQKENIYMGVCFLHGIEALVVLASLYFALLRLSWPFANWALFIIIGFVFHQFLDAIDLFKRGYRFDKVISFAYSLKNARGKRLLQDS
jgi:membrane-bound metal-dependent hydrolase YbcI (DUF457 family)